MHGPFGTGHLHRPAVRHSRIHGERAGQTAHRTRGRVAAPTHSRREPARSTPALHYSNGRPEAPSARLFSLSVLIRVHPFSAHKPASPAGESPPIGTGDESI